MKTGITLLVCLAITILSVGCSVGLSKWEYKPIPEKIVYVQIDGKMTTDSVKDAVKAMEEADSNTIVKIRLESPGGWVAADHLLVLAYDNTRAKDVIVYVEYEAASSAAAFLIHVKHRVVGPHAFILFHQASACSPPLPSEIVNHTPTIKQDGYDVVCRKITADNVKELNLQSGDETTTVAFEDFQLALREAQEQNVLTPQELELVMKGQNVSMTGAEFNRRTSK